MAEPMNYLGTGQVVYLNNNRRVAKGVFEKPVWKSSFLGKFHFGGTGITHLLLLGPPSALGPWLHPNLPTGLNYIKTNHLNEIL